MDAVFAAALVVLPLFMLVLMGAQLRDALRALAATAGTAPVTVSNHAEQIAQLEAQLKALARDFNDLDERSEHRYRKITQRERRAESAAGAAAEPQLDAQTVFSMLGPPAENGSAAPPRLRMMRPR